MTDAFNPVERYDAELRASFEANARECFEKLMARSGVNPEENARTVKEYNEWLEEAGNANRMHRAFGCGIIFVVAAMLAAVGIGVWIIMTEGNTGIELLDVEPAACGALCAVAVIFAVFSLCAWLVPGLNNAKAQQDEFQEKAREALRRAYEQMAPLNRLYTWDLVIRIIEKTFPYLSFDRYSCDARMRQFQREFGWNCSFGDDVSVLFTQSGEMGGNPFAFCKLLKMSWGSETYSGSITIHWTTVERDANGKRYTQHHSEVLTATVTKPKPVYGENTIFVYANDAAPNLTFTRRCSELSQLGDGFFDRMKMRSERKKLEEFSRNLEDNSNYTMMANKEFETLFNTIDRNDEVEFRVLFTPMGQRNMLELIKDKTIGYGDDFSFFKTHKINTISPAHLNEMDLDTRPERFRNFNLAEAQEYFLSWTCEYFRSIYFAMAPIFAIPVYLQTIPQSRLQAYPELSLNSANAWECEAMANYLGDKKFAHSASVTRNILKVNHPGEGGRLRNVSVTAKGYRTVQHTEYVSRFGGDGRMHDVPVKWLEYLPVEKVSSFFVDEACTSRPKTQEEKKIKESSSGRAEILRRGIYCGFK